LKEGGGESLLAGSASGRMREGRKRESLQTGKGKKGEALGREEDDDPLAGTTSKRRGNEKCLIQDEFLKDTFSRVIESGGEKTRVGGKASRMHNYAEGKAEGPRKRRVKGITKGEIFP